MARHKHASERSVRHSRRWRGVAAWSGGLGLAVLVLGAAADLAGRPQPKHPTGLADTLAAVGGRAPVALAIACAALLHAAWCIRHLILHWLAWWPGRIEVTTFTAGTPLTDANAEQLTLGFRQRLMTLHLQAPTPVPGAATEGDFLDVLGRNGMDARNPLATLIGLLRAAKPTHAYEVRGVLSERAEAPRFGVTVRVLRLPSEGTAPVTHWAETWELALRKAADEATAMILPQTRLCRAPWGAWRGYVMPSGLLHAFEEGARLERSRRYDEALAMYWRAVELDPLNMVLRLRVGQLQERLGLYLDALATYWGMAETSQPPRPANPLRERRGRRERHRALLSARYRCNVLLGGRVLAKQWVTTPDESCVENRRDEQRRQLRECLRPLLQRKLEQFGTTSRVERALAAAAQTEDAPFLDLRTLFAQYALYDCACMRVELRPRDRATLTPETVRLTELSISLRLDWVRHRSALLEERPSHVRWPPAPRELDDEIRGIEGRRPFRHWHEHYNAACAYALALHDQRLLDVDTLAGRAVDRLERATARAASDYIASRRDWVLSEDPDLKGLRGRHKFQVFELLYLPSDPGVAIRPRNVQQLENSRYVRDLIVQTAERWGEAWRAHGDRPPGTPEVWKRFDDERRAWEGLREVARNFRHSRTRFELINDLRAGAARYGFARPAVPFPRYDDEPLSPKTNCEAAYKSEITRADGRLATLAERAGKVLDDLDGWLATLRSLDAEGRPIPAVVLRRRCVHHAALWQLLAHWFAARDPDAGRRAEEDFRARVARVPLDSAALNGAGRTNGAAVHS
jgi:hypothetical protein